MQNGRHFYPDPNPPPSEYQGYQGHEYHGYQGPEYQGYQGPEYQGYQGNNDYTNFPVASPYGAELPPGTKHMKHFHGIEFQPSEVCPKNFIIFDQTDHRSQIMFHPAIAHKFNNPGLNMGAPYAHGNFVGEERHDEAREISSTMKEDSGDIDALLSLEGEEEQEEYDEEEVSTARTYGNYGSSSPESCSNYGTKTRKKNRSSSSAQRSSGGASSNCDSDVKRQKMKKMVRALRGIVPGGNQMNTATVLDEAVQYLKSLKVEVKKLGVGNLED